MDEFLPSFLCNPSFSAFVPSPNAACSYKSAARDVLEESRLTATDPVKQFAISFFDNKFIALIPLKVAYFLDRQDSLHAMDFFDVTVKVPPAAMIASMLTNTLLLAIATSNTSLRRSAQFDLSPCSQD